MKHVCVKAGDLATHGFDEGRHGVTDAGNGDARAHVEELVSVDVDQDGALGAIDVDGETDGESRH
jgi:hypothetical protein